MQQRWLVGVTMQLAASASAAVGLRLHVQLHSADAVTYLSGYSILQNEKMSVLLKVRILLTAKQK